MGRLERAGAERSWIMWEAGLERHCWQLPRTKGVKGVWEEAAAAWMVRTRDGEAGSGRLWEEQSQLAENSRIERKGKNDGRSKNGRRTQHREDEQGPFPAKFSGSGMALLASDSISEAVKSVWGITLRAQTQPTQACHTEPSPVREDRPHTQSQSTRPPGTRRWLKAKAGCFDAANLVHPAGLKLVYLDSDVNPQTFPEGSGKGNYQEEMKPKDEGKGLFCLMAKEQGP